MKTLQEFRTEIDQLDEKLITLLARRYQIVQEVGHYKAQHGLNVIQSDRVEIVRARVRMLALENGLDSEFVVGLYNAMIDHAHVLEEEIKAQYEKD